MIYGDNPAECIRKYVVYYYIRAWDHFTEDCSHGVTGQESPKSLPSGPKGRKEKTECIVGGLIEESHMKRTCDRQWSADGKHGRQ